MPVGLSSVKVSVGVPTLTGMEWCLSRTTSLVVADIIRHVPVHAHLGADRVPAVDRCGGHVGNHDAAATFWSQCVQG
jgi:hypothetical protein